MDSKRPVADPTTPPAAISAPGKAWFGPKARQRHRRLIQEFWQRQIQRWRRQQPGWWPMLLYGLVLGFGVFVLNGLDYAFRARMYPGDVYFALLAVIFLALGIWVGIRLVPHANATQNPDATNTAAQSSLGISGRELEVLKALAMGQANKEIARDLDISPNTVKTHVSKLYEKLGSSNRTEAVHRARSLGILP